MNKKVFKTMIALVVIFLVGMYILKIFFPQEFVMAIQNDKIIEIGNYIDTNKWLYYPFCILTSFITYYLFTCATTRQWKLKWWQCLLILGVIGASIGLEFVDINLCTALSYTSFVFVPVICGARAKELGVCYTIHIFSQTLTVSIRNLPMYIQYYNTLFAICLTFEMYLWLVLFYLFYNYKKEVKV